jgi:DNA-binding response OmpR family regulator
MIEDMLEDLGCRVAASVTSVPAALEAADTADADVAVLDLNLRGHSAFPVAAVLKRRGIPILFSTGYGSAGLESEWRDCQVIQKPFPIERLGAAIAEVMRKSC